MGSSSANHLLIVPLRINNEVLGILELASFNEFEEYKIQFIEKLGESIASSILSVKSAEKTQELLKESQSITQELRQKEEELRENQSRMIEAHKKLKRELEKSESIIFELRRSLKEQKKD